MSGTGVQIGPNSLIGRIVGCAIVILVLRAGSSLWDRVTNGDAVEAANQRIVLELGGQEVQLPLEHFNVYLVETKGEVESFEMRGPDVVLTGEFPAGVQVDYEENWKVLLQRTMDIGASGGDPSDPTFSTITLPALGACRVVGGSFVIETIGEGKDAKTPLSGTCTIRCETPQGPKTIEGRFAVNGTTWG
jgi:hypothetical protein